MKVIWHQQIITHEPRGGGALPNVMQRALHRSLRQPLATLLCADSEEYPIWSAERNVDALCRGAASGVAKWDFAHGGQSIAGRINRKGLDGAERQLCPTKSNCGRAALPRRPSDCKVGWLYKRRTPFSLSVNRLCETSSSCICLWEMWRQWCIMKIRFETRLRLPEFCHSFRQRSAESLGKYSARGRSQSGAPEIRQLTELVLIA